MIHVKVPATTANLGPGFDCLGLALNCYNSYSFGRAKTGLQLEGFDERYQNEDNLVYTSLRDTFEKAGRSPENILIRLDGEEIPVSRGLGSSAACVVAGVFGANALMGEPFSKKELFFIASEIEGHPDNVAPAVFGNLTVSIRAGERFFCEVVPVAEGVSFVALVPDFKLATSDARRVLPRQISREDAIFNMGRAAMLPLLFQSGQLEALGECLDDRLHQPYRKELIDGFGEMVQAASDSGAWGTFLSGAGPTVMAVVQKGQVEQVVDRLSRIQAERACRWDVLPLCVERQGLSLWTD